MDYSGQEFYDLVREVEAQGGEHLNVLHEPRPLEIPAQQKGGVKQSGLKTTGCNDATILSLSYERGIFGGEPSTDQQIHIGTTTLRPDPDEREERPAHMAQPVDEKDDSIVVCAIDDAVGLWPRFLGTWEEDGDA